MPADLLFEIGCEEIPAQLLTRALVDLPPLVDSRLGAARLGHAGVRALGTPRRLAVIVKQVADRQPDLHEEVVGPPAGAAFAADGTLTKAGQGFAAKNGVDPAALARREVAGKKGLYVVAVRNVVGQATRGLLPDLLADIARSITWAKSQRWGWGETPFVRPVQWLVALLGGEVIPLSWAGVTSSRSSRGHRFLANAPVEIASADSYVEALRAAHVVVDQDVRRDLVRAELARLERETGLRVRPDEELLDEVIHLGEYPVGLSGGFDASYLDVPAEIIVTAMRTHQRYFAMERKDGALANRFATVMATIVKDPAVVAAGNERVLASRLSDARFFVDEDRKKTFADWNTKLDAVVFQAKLGDKARTIGHKVRRITHIARLIAQAAADPGFDARVAAAAQLCKADLASSAVGEFPELQGVMGKYYAGWQGQPPQVAIAIEQHYWPKGQGAANPTSDEAAVIALADRIDTLVGCFASGLAPTGSADPLGLRRAAIAILSILTERNGRAAAPTTRMQLGLSALIHHGEAAFGDTGVPVAGARDAVLEFFRARLRGMLLDQGLPSVAIEQGIGAGFDDPNDLQHRVRELARVPDQARQVFKRIGNILDDATAAGASYGGEIDPKLFASSDGVEARLWAAFDRRATPLATAHAQKRYGDMIQVLVDIEPEVSALFDKKGGVMVMDPDPALQRNRLTLLKTIYARFAMIGDFRQGGAA